MSKILINASEEELRVAMVTDQRLEDFYYERCDQGTAIASKANICKGRITRVEPSLEAAFIEFGSGRQGFLPFREISAEYLSKPRSGGGETSIQNRLKEGQELMVQVMKEERGNKGAALTTYITLAGCYLVLMPNNPQAGGISRRIAGEERDELRDTLNQLTIPERMGVIIRTAGVDKQLDELQWDLDILVQQWTAINDAYTQRSAPFLIHQESNVLIRTIRDHFRPEVEEIIIDDVDVFTKAKNYIERVRPDYLARLKLYQDEASLFARYQVEKQVADAFEHEVRLPSGGSIVVDRTEALISIDINSAKATRGSDIEETALQTNLEAADEIARQLRLRDLGGLVVIDFIDMTPVQNQREVENRLRNALKADRARIQMGRISRFGLLEMSRQRLHPALGEAHQVICPQCHGQSTIRGVEALAMTMLRLIEEAAVRPDTRQVRVQLPVAAATLLLNEKRLALARIEERHQTQVMIIPNESYLLPRYKLDTFTADSAAMQQRHQSSYKLSQQAPHEALEPVDKEAHQRQTAKRHHEPAVKHHVPVKPKDESQGLIKRLWSAMFGTTTTVDAEPEMAKPRKSSHHRPHDGRRGGQRGRGGQQRHRSSGSRGGQQQQRARQPQAQNQNQERQDAPTTAQSQEANAEGQKQQRTGTSNRQGQQRRRSGPRRPRSSEQGQRSSEQGQGPRSNEQGQGPRSSEQGSRQQSQQSDTQQSERQRQQSEGQQRQQSDRPPSPEKKSEDQGIQ